MRDVTLWDRIRRHPFPPPEADDGEVEGRSALSARLEEAEGWAADYARSAVEEYRRFVYLSRISRQQVTPSAVIDRVWHEHVTDSRDYIEGFCRGLFGEILHHEPGRPEEADRFEAQYAATRALYESEFGAPPPEDIWIHRPAAQVRRDRTRAVVATLAGIGTALAVGYVTHVWFGWWLGALFSAAVAGVIVNEVLKPRVPGPRYSSSDSSGCSSCGD